MNWGSDVPSPGKDFMCDVYRKTRNKKSSGKKQEAEEKELKELENLEKQEGGKSKLDDD